jgi:hypothetical protein
VVKGEVEVRRQAEGAVERESKGEGGARERERAMY